MNSKLIFLLALAAISQSTPLAKPSQEKTSFPPLPDSIFIKDSENFDPQTRNDFLYRLTRDTGRIPMKRSSNYWTINSLGYHGGLGNLFDAKTKRSENKRSLFPQMKTRSVSDYDDFDREDIMRQAEAELIRRGYRWF